MTTMRTRPGRARWQLHRSVAIAALSLLVHGGLPPAPAIAASAEAALSRRILTDSLLQRLHREVLPRISTAEILRGLQEAADLERDGRGLTLVDSATGRVLRPRYQVALPDRAEFDPAPAEAPAPAPPALASADEATMNVLLTPRALLYNGDLKFFANAQVLPNMGWKNDPDGEEAKALRLGEYVPRFLTSKPTRQAWIQAADRLLPARDDVASPGSYDAAKAAFESAIGARWDACAATQPPNLAWIGRDLPDGYGTQMGPSGAYSWQAHTALQEFHLSCNVGPGVYDPTRTAPTSCIQVWSATTYNPGCSNTPESFNARYYFGGGDFTTPPGAVLKTFQDATGGWGDLLGLARKGVGGARLGLLGTVLNYVVIYALIGSGWLEELQSPPPERIANVGRTNNYDVQIPEAAVLRPPAVEPEPLVQRIAASTSWSIAEMATTSTGNLQEYAGDTSHVPQSDSEVGGLLSWTYAKGDGQAVRRSRITRRFGSVLLPFDFVLRATKGGRCAGWAEIELGVPGGGPTPKVIRLCGLDPQATQQAADAPEYLAWSGLFKLRAKELGVDHFDWIEFRAVSSPGGTDRAATSYFLVHPTFSTEEETADPVLATVEQYTANSLFRVRVTHSATVQLVQYRIDAGAWTNANKDGVAGWHWFQFANTTAPPSLLGSHQIRIRAVGNAERAGHCNVSKEYTRLLTPNDTAPYMVAGTSLPVVDADLVAYTHPYGHPFSRKPDPGTAALVRYPFGVAVHSTDSVLVVKNLWTQQLAPAYSVMAWMDRDLAGTFVWVIDDVKYEPMGVWLADLLVDFVDERTCRVRTYRLSPGLHTLSIEYQSVDFNEDPQAPIYRWTFPIWVRPPGKPRANSAPAVPRRITVSGDTVYVSTAYDTVGTLLAGAALDQEDALEAVETRVDNGGWSPVTTQAADTTLWAVELDPGTLGGGNHLVDLRARAGSATSSVMTVGLTDNALPVVSVDPDYDVDASRNLTVRGTARDEDDSIRDVEVRLDGGFWWPADTLAAGGAVNWTFRWIPADSGFHRVEARAVDRRGLYSDVAGISAVVFTHPTLAVAAMDIDLEANEVRLAGRALDSDSGIQSVQASVDTTNWTAASLDGETWSFTWDVSQVADGDRHVWLRAQGGGATSSVLDVLVPLRRPPVVSVARPPGIASAQVTLTGAAADSFGSGVAGVYVAIDPEPQDFDFTGETLPSSWKLASDTSGDGSWSSWRYVWGIQSASDGEHVAYVVSKNDFTYSAPDSVYFAFQHPWVALVAPRGGELWNGWPGRGEGDVAWDVGDPDSTVASLSYTIERSQDGASWTALVADTVTTDRTWHWGTWAEPDGKYLLRVTAKDAHGLTATSRLRRTLEIDHITPPAWRRAIGAQRAEGHRDSITVWWNTAEDPSQPVHYNVYYSQTTPIDFATAAVDTAVAALVGGGAYRYRYTIGGLDPGCVRYYVAVRAQDSSFLGNEDANRVEVSAVTQYFTPDRGESWTLATLAADAGLGVLQLAAPPSTYRVFCSIGISPRDTLRLAPGDQLQFTGKYSIIVRGGLYADGLPGNAVAFQWVQPDTGRTRWSGVEFTDGSHGSITRCSFSNAERAIRCGTANMQVANATFSRCFRGVVTWGEADIDVLSNSFWQCTTGLEISSSAQVESNAVLQCGTGIVAGSSPRLFQNTVTQSERDGIVLAGSGPETVAEQNVCRSNGRYGIMLGPFYAGGCAAQVLDNTVDLNTNSGIMCWPGTQALIGRGQLGAGNLIQANGGAGIECRDASPRIVGNTIVANAGNGLLLYGFQQASRPIVTGNRIQGNDAANGNLVGVKVLGGALPVLGDLANLSTEDDGGNRILDHTWNLWNDWAAGIAAEGNYWGSTDSATVDGKIRDDDENITVGRVDFLPLVSDPDAPDLSLGGADLALARSGADVDVQAAVRNLGPSAADSVTVRFESPRGVLLGTVLLPRVEAESLAVATQLWSGAASGTSADTLWVEVDPGDRISERVELNNRAFAVAVAPELRLESPGAGAVWTGRKHIVWRSQSPTGRELSFDVAWRADSTASWMDLGTGLEGSEFTWDTVEFPSGHGMQVRVRADDGVRVAEATSNASVNLRNDFPSRTVFAAGASADTTLVFPDDGDSLTVVVALPESVSVASATLDLAVVREHHVDQEQAIFLNPFARSEVSGLRQVFQLFQPTEDRLSRIEVYGEGMGARWTAELRPASGGLPGDSVLARRSLTVTASDGPRWIEFDFGEVPLPEGTPVCLVLAGDGGCVETYNECGIGGNCDAYPAGHCGFSLDGGVLWDAAGAAYDLAFRTYAPFVPARVALTVGADDDAEWLALEPADTLASLTALAAEIGGYLAAHADAEDGTVDGLVEVPLCVEASDRVALRLFNMSVTYLDQAPAALGEERMLAVQATGDAWLGVANLEPRTYYASALGTDGTAPTLRLFGPGLHLVAEFAPGEWLHAARITEHGGHLLQVQGSPGTRVGALLASLATMRRAAAASDTASGYIRIGDPGAENPIDLLRLQAAQSGRYTARLESVDAGVAARVYAEDGVRDLGGTPSGDIFWSGPRALGAGGSRIVAWAASGAGTWRHRTASFEGGVPVPISSVVADADSDFVPDSLGARVTVEGVALCDRSTFATAGGDVALDDGTGGIGLRIDPMNPAGITRGDRLIAHGLLVQVQGRSLLPNPIVTFLSAANSLPDTLRTTSGALAAGGEVFENRLVRLEGVSIVAGNWPAPGADGTVEVDDGSGRATLEVLRATDLDDTGSPVGSFDVVGIVVQSDSTAPCSSGYRLRPRTAADITNTNHAPLAFTQAEPANGAAVDTLLPRLVWRRAADPEGDPVSYLLECWREGGPDTVRVAGLADTVYTVPAPLPNGTFHRWSVTALDTLGAARVAQGAPWRFRVLVPQAELELGAASLAGVVFRGDSLDIALEIRNIGGAPLEFSFVEEPAAATVPGMMSVLAAKSGGAQATPTAAWHRTLPGRSARAARAEYIATDIAWLEVAPASGTLATDSTLAVVVRLRGDVAAGRHAATLHLATNDPDEGSIDIPVEMRVPLYRFADHRAGRLQLTTTDGGALGYWDVANATSFGSGLRFPTGSGPSHLFHGSIWLGTDSLHVLDTSYDRDWEPRGRLTLEGSTPETYRASFADSTSPAALGLRVAQTSIAPATAPDDGFVILSYEVERLGSSPPAVLYGGLYLDLDVASDYRYNAGAFDAGRGLGYLYNTRGTQTWWVGAVFLGGAPRAGFRFVYNPDYVWPTGNITDSDKWRFLTSGISDGTTDIASDWSILLPVGPMLVAPGSRAVMVFAIVAGQSLAELQANADAARQHYTQYVTDVAQAPPARLELVQNYPNPFNPSTRIEFGLPAPARTRLAVYDVRGRLVALLLDRHLEAGRHHVLWHGRDPHGQPAASGLYLYRLDAEGQGRLVRKMLLIK